MIDGPLDYEVRPESSYGLFGYRTFTEGEPVSWDACGLRTLVSSLSRSIQRESRSGGTIVVKERGQPEVVWVDPCPTGHANLKDDFMGGTLCADCRAMW